MFPLLWEITLIYLIDVEIRARCFYRERTIGQNDTDHFGPGVHYGSCKC